MRTRAIFGPAGRCQMAEADKIKTTESLMVYLAEKGVDAFEYQCGRGVNIGREKAELIGSIAAGQGIELSIHAPYYISLASAEPEKRVNSISYIVQTAVAARWMGAKRIVVHPGGLGKLTREDATVLACETLAEAVRRAGEEAPDVHVCPEVMGKVNQLGNLSEVLTFCSLDESMIPCVDFGHLNSRLQGDMDYSAALDEIFERLGRERAKTTHIHFSKIEYSKGGEVRHLTFEDEQFGPDYRGLMEQLADRGMTSTVICESAGTQTLDSLTMKQYYMDYSGR